MRHHIWLFLAVAACSQDSTSQPVDLNTAAAEIAAAQCARVFECCDAQEVGRLFQSVEDVASCTPVVENYMTTFVLPALDDALTRGAIQVDESKRATCISSLRQKTCESFVPSPNLNMFTTTDCRPWIKARLEISGFCQEDFECVSGFCARDSGTLEGTCKEAPAQDEACVVERCAVGFYCADQMCLPSLSTGAECSRNDECKSNNCVDGLDGRVCGTQPTACQG
jgi:hypothetical protein